MTAPVPNQDVVVGATTASTAPSGPNPKLTKPPPTDDFPRGIPYIVGNEGAERFSFYGMRAILYVYMTSLFLTFQDQAGLPPDMVAAAKAQATQVNHLFIAAVYAFPMIGAILSDRLLGKYNVIFWVSLIYCAGHGVLAVAGRLAELGQFQNATYGMYMGLALIAIGSGGIKPCVSANVGDQFTAENGHLVTKVYQIFYFIINFGSFFSTIITPYLNKKYGPEVAFGVPGVIMGIATLVFWLGRKKFVRQPPNPGGKLGGLDFLASVLLFAPIALLIFAFFAGEGHFDSAKAAGLQPNDPMPFGTWLGVWTSHLAGTYWPHFLAAIACVALGYVVARYRWSLEDDPGFLRVLTYSFANRGQRKPGEGFFDVARAKYGEEAAEGPPAVLRIMVVFSMVLVFWALFDQHSSTWIEQAGRMELGLTLPSRLMVFGQYGIPALAVYGFVWLMLWVSNMPLPKMVNIGVIGLFVLGGVIAGVLDLVNRDTTFLQLDAQQLSALNPLMVMVIIPLLNVAVYKPLEKRGVQVKPLHKMVAGMFLAAAAFGTAALLQLRIESAAASGVKVHALWQAVQYFVMTTSEVLVSITGLEFAYTQAPRKMKSTIMGFWLLCVTFGNILVAFLAPLQAKFALSSFFLLFTGLMVGAALIFTVLAYFYKGKTYLQQAKAA